MREYIVEKSSLTYRGTFRNMLTSLPVPGTSAFATLCRGLQPYDLTPTGIVVEAPSSRLADVTVGILLLKRIVELRLSYGEFTLNVQELYEEDIASLVNIMEIMFNALRETDVDADQGQVKVSSSAHLRLMQGEAREFIEDHLHGGNSGASLVPDAFAYNLKLDGRPDVKESRIVVAKSLIFPNALFVDFSIEYVAPVGLPQIPRRIRNDYQQALELLGLTPGDAPEGGNTP